MREIRNKSFPEIKGVILIIKIPFPIPGAAVFWLLPKVNLLVFTNKCEKIGKKALVGLIAHELSHFSIFQKGNCRGFWKLFFFGDLKRAIREERKTDKFAIRKGYGKEILATKVAAEKLLKGTKWERYLDRYLSPKEVREYMRDLKK